MAFFNQDEEENKPAAGAGGVLRTGEAGAQQGQAGGGGTSAPQASQPQQKGSGWTNLKSYLDANAGEGQRMAGQLAGGFGADTDKAISEIGSKAATETAELGTAKAQTAGANYFADPTNIGKSDFDRYYTQGMTDAQKTFDAGTVGALPEQWRQKAGLAEQGQGGRKALIGEYLTKGSGDYSGGMGSLDAFMLGQTDLGKQLGAKSQGVEDALTKAQTDFAVARDKKAGELGAAQGEFRKLFDAARQAEAAKAAAAYTPTGFLKDPSLKAAYDAEDIEGFARRGQEYDARENALAQLIGQSVAGRDWAGLASKQIEAKKARDAEIAAAMKAREASGGPGSSAASVGVYAKPRTDPQAVMNNQAVNAADPTAGMSEDEQQAYLEKKYWEQQGG